MVESVLTATSIVASSGELQDVTIEKVSQKAGVSPGSIYQYFSEKNAILGEAVVHELEENLKFTLAKINEWKHLPVRDFIRNMVEISAAYHQRRLDRAQHIFIASSAVGRLDDHMEMRNEVIYALAGVFRTYQELQYVDCERAAAVIVHALMGVFTAPMQDKNFLYSISELKTDVTKMILGYLSLQ